MALANSKVESELSKGGLGYCCIETSKMVRKGVQVVASLFAEGRGVFEWPQCRGWAPARFVYLPNFNSYYSLSFGIIFVTIATNCDMAARASIEP